MVRVLVCGGGIGGLTLAQALREAADVVVLDRDPGATATGGYRLALNGAATAVLHRHLDSGLMQQVRAVSDGPERFASFTIANNQLRPIVYAAEDGEDRLLAQRRALRLLLTRGLEDRVRFATTVHRVEEHDDHAVVHTTGGARYEADLVVGAEGPLSPTVSAVAGRALNTPTGLIGIAGSTPYAGRDGSGRDGSGRDAPPWLRTGPGLAFDAQREGGGIGMFLSLTSTGSGPIGVDLADAIGPPALVWGLIAPEQVLTGVDRRDPTALIEITRRVAVRWQGWLLDRIAASDPDRVAAFTFRAADPRADLTPWRPRRITAIGDAVHAMPPTGGQAAATAIQDAGHLADRLLDHLQGGASLSSALRAYHQAMPGWARPALRESLGPVRIIRALRAPPVAAVARAGLALAGRVSPAGRRLR